MLCSLVVGVLTCWMLVLAQSLRLLRRQVDDLQEQVLQQQRTEQDDFENLDMRTGRTVAKVRQLRAALAEHVALPFDVVHTKPPVARVDTLRHGCMRCGHPAHGAAPCLHTGECDCGYAL